MSHASHTQALYNHSSTTDSDRNHYAMRAHLLNSPRTDTERPRSWWSTALSLTIHGAIIALLWSAPSLPINTPEVAPPESIDATILPPPPAEKPAEKPDTPPAPVATPAATPSAHSAPSAAPKSASASASSADQRPSSADGTQAAGAGQSDTAQANKGNGDAKKPLPSGVPVAVEPSGGFQIDYDLDASGSNNAAASGGARLVFTRKGDRYVADLSAKASTLFLTAKINGHSEG